MHGTATLLRGSPRGSGYPGSEAGAPADGSVNPEFALHSPSVASGETRRGGIVGEAIREASQEGLVGRSPLLPHPQILTLPLPGSPLLLPRT